MKDEVGGLEGVAEVVVVGVKQGSPLLYREISASCMN